MRYVHVDEFTKEDAYFVRLCDLALDVLHLTSWPACWERYQNLHPVVLAGGEFRVFSSILQNYQPVSRIEDLWKLDTLTRGREKELLLVDESWAQDAILAHESGVSTVEIVINKSKVRYAWKHHLIKHVGYKNAIGYGSNNELVPRPATV
jgi:hypothetical protein